MSVIVQKFGGTSVANLERIRNAALRTKAEHDRGNNVVVVVSAMAGTTNQLVDWTGEAAALHDTREYDAVVSTGEQITAGLFAIILQEMGISARSWLGWQLPIRTDSSHGSARIQEIDVQAIHQRFEERQVAVIAGFQGLSVENRITTLGRGGTDDGGGGGFVVLDGGGGGFVVLDGGGGGGFVAPDGGGGGFVALGGGGGGQELGVPKERNLQIS